MISASLQRPFTAQGNFIRASRKALRANAFLKDCLLWGTLESVFSFVPDSAQEVPGDDLDIGSVKSAIGLNVMRLSNTVCLFVVILCHSNSISFISWW